MRLFLFLLVFVTSCSPASRKGEPANNVNNINNANNHNNLNSENCPDNTTWNGTFCENDTRIRECAGLPEGALWVSATSFTQTWDGTAWMPPENGVHESDPGSLPCRFGCMEELRWDDETQSCLSCRVQMIADPDFLDGFTVVPWTVRLDDGETIPPELVPGWDTEPPAWRLCQWSSRKSLQPPGTLSAEGVWNWANDLKAIRIGHPESSHPGLTLSINSDADYEGQYRTHPSEPWPHLLVEQVFPRSFTLTQLQELRIRFEATVHYSLEAGLHEPGYNPGLHTGQYNMFFIVQNRVPGDPDYGNMLWFGIPLYDYRYQDIPEYIALDFADVSSKLIYTYSSADAGTGSSHQIDQWFTVDLDMLDKMKQAVDYAYAEGLFLSGDYSKYSVNYMNIGWEAPGRYIGTVILRDLTLHAALDMETCRAIAPGTVGEKRHTK